jgi:dihydrodipicolinate synthase/N-acetylneuraminate lyase
MDEEITITNQIFRFLDHSEFAALSQSEKIEYLERAIEATKRGAPIVTLEQLGKTL